MTDDRGLAALAAALSEMGHLETGWLHWGDHIDRFAAALLGEHGVYLADGWPEAPHQHNTDACDECDAIYTMGREDAATLGTTPLAATPAPLDVERLAAKRVVTEYDKTHLTHDVAYENVADAIDALRVALIEMRRSCDP